MKYLLDTNTCVYLLNGNEILKRKVKEIGVYSLSISNCVLAGLTLISSANFFPCPVTTFFHLLQIRISVTL